MEALLKRFAWIDKLRTPVCKRVWARVEALNAEASQTQAMMNGSAQWLGGEYFSDVLGYASD